MRSEIEQLSKIGTLPSEGSAPIALLEKIQTSIQAIKPPITNEEARILVSLFGREDSCYGLAWSLVHLIESTPGWPIAECISNPQNEWTSLLRDRVLAGRKK